MIVVGDVDVDAMERKIRDVMSSIPKAENPARKEVYDIPQRDKPRYGLVTDPETKAVAVKLIFAPTPVTNAWWPFSGASPHAGTPSC